jgi:PAS domain-containing protein
VAASTSGGLRRLSAVIARQRQELDRERAEAAARTVLDVARGILVERLGCSAAEAGKQLARLSEQSGTSAAEIAAQIAGAGAFVPGSPAGPDHAAAGPDGAAGPDRRSVLAAARADQAPDLDGVATALLDEALRPLGAVAVAFWLLEPDGGLELAGLAGFTAREASRWRRIHPDMQAPAQAAVRDDTDLWWPAGPPDGMPLIGGCRGGQAVLRLREHDHTIGAVVACWADRLPEFDPQLRRQLLRLAEVCVSALGGEARQRTDAIIGLLDGVADCVLVASPLRGEDGRVTDFRIDHLSAEFVDPAGRDRADLLGRSLLELYPAAAIDGGVFDHALHAVATGEPRHLSGEIITSLAADMNAAPVLDIRIARLFGGVVITWRRADERERLASLLEHAQRLGRIGSWEENLLTGQVHWTDSTFALFGQPVGTPLAISALHGRVPADDRQAWQRFRDKLLRERRQAAAVFRIVRADDGSIRQLRAFAEPVTDPAGGLVAVRGAYQDISADYHTQVAFAAARDQLANTQQRAEEERRLALRLQEAITPRTARPVEVAGLDVAARYRPADSGATLVSGDWYDTALLPAGCVLLVVGDIAGHGLDAVHGMVTMRNCLRGLAITGAGPATLLGWLNNFACHLTDGIIGTAICGLYDPASRVLRWARAGHLPPLLVREGVTTELPEPTGLMLGADPDADYAEAETALQAGDVLLLFTDGLVERRDLPLDQALSALGKTAAKPVRDVRELADLLVRDAAADTGDDACLVAVQVS